METASEAHGRQPSSRNRSRADLTVIGKHGRDVAEERLLGSVTMRVLAEPDGDVLASTSSQTTD